MGTGETHDIPIVGSAYVVVSSRGARIAVFVGDGRVIRVVLNRPGDATDLVTKIATTVTAGLYPRVRSGWT